MALLLRGARFGQDETEEVADEAEAAVVTYWAITDNTWSPEKLVDGEGNVVLAEKELWDAAWKYGDTLDQVRA